MNIDFSRRRYILLWQLLFLLIGTSWLWASHLNPHLSYRTTLISQYEIPSQPFAWLFRLCDFLAGGLMMVMAIYLARRQRRVEGWLLLAISLGLMADPILSTTCHQVGQNCREYFSFKFLLHAIETVFTASAFFITSIYDAYRRKKLVSIAFVAFQAVYGLQFSTQWVSQEHVNTAAQYFYQISLLIWVAWYSRDLLAEKNFPAKKGEEKTVRNFVAAWAFLNGILAIIISLAHINLLGKIKGLYFSGDSAWLAQHGVIVGVAMLYLSRHLARGELRARQIFLLLSGIEVLKYSVISPNATLMLVYLLTFVGLFIFRDDFDRGALPITWRVRLRDLYYLLGGLLMASLIGLALLDRDSRASTITSRAIDHFSDYVANNPHVPHGRLQSILLADSISVFLAAAVSAVLWVLFKPNRATEGPRHTHVAESLLNHYSRSSEDYFKLWPTDKEYFWSPSHDGFIAYKIVGPVAFALADPIGQNQAKLITNFNAWCRSQRLTAAYLPVYPKSRPLYEAAGLQCQQIGSSALINIEIFINQTAKDKWWRWRLNKSQKTGYQYRLAQPPHSDNFLNELKNVSNSWLKTGGHKERAFALGYFDEAYLQHCAVHYLVDGQGAVVAFTNQVPQFTKLPTATVDMLRYSPVGGDSMAYLLYETISQLRSEYKYFDLGFVPFAKARGSMLTIAKTVAAGQFSSKGLEQFKNKFDPDWQENYLAYDGDVADLAIVAINLENAMKVKLS